MPSSWLKVGSFGLSMVWKLYAVPRCGLSVAAEADPARVTAPAASRPDATVAAATLAAFLLMDFMSVNPFVNVAGTHRVSRSSISKCGGSGRNSGGLGETLVPSPPALWGDQMLAQSSGRKLAVGCPLARMLLLLPW